MNKFLIEMYLVRIKKSHEATLLLKGAKGDYEKKEFNFNQDWFYKSIKELEKITVKKNDTEDMPKKLTKKEQIILIEEEKITKKIRSVLKSPKSAIEKKLELFEVLERVDFGELSTSENQRVNSLIKSRLYSELAKEYMKEYKKSTAEEFSKIE